MSSSLLGREGERLAAEYLRKNGYKMVDSGFRSRFGEIDLIVQKGKIIVFVEVKLRKNDTFAKAFEHVNHKKQEKIKATALSWIASYDKGYDYRFDVFEVYTALGKVNHIENAFE